MSALLPFIPLLIAAGILLGGNGVMGTLIALRGAEEGFSAAAIGIMGTSYFLGFLVSSMLVTRLLQAVGHIRAFATLAALATIATIMMLLVIDNTAWIALRFVHGACFAGLFATIESWLNSGISNQVRGKVLALYRILDVAVVTGSQFLLPLFGTGGFVLFCVVSMMLCLSLVPVSLADRSNPVRPESHEFSLKLMWVISPMACIGCVSIGMTNAAFRLIGPLYAQEIGLSITSVATFMTAGIVSGAVLQYPLGQLSDRYDRRWVLVAATLGATLSGLYLSFGAGTDPLLNYVGIFAFGAFALPLYSLSAAHANDRADASQYVLVAAGLMFFYGVGASIGPFAAALLIETFGPQALFNYTSIVHGSLIILTLVRMRQRESVPVGDRKGFQMLLRTSANMTKMTRSADEKAQNKDSSG
ncbi:MAG: MFS transporter [Pseudomonadota bacterium]